MTHPEQLPPERPVHPWWTEPRLYDTGAIVLGIVTGALFVAGDWPSGLTFAVLTVTWLFLGLSERRRRETVDKLEATERMLEETHRLFRDDLP